MSDVSEMRIDWPHIPRQLLEMFEGYTAHGPTRRNGHISTCTIIDGKRDEVLAFITLVGAYIDWPKQNNHVIAFEILDDNTKELLIGAKQVYLKDLDNFFNRGDNHE